jgi:hypothetical protein
MKVLGVDPGIQGGLAIVEHAGDTTVLLDAIDVPVIRTGAKERVDVAAVRVNAGRQLMEQQSFEALVLPPPAKETSHE